MTLHLFKTAIKNVFSKSNTSLLSMLGLTIAFISIFYILSYVSFELVFGNKQKALTVPDQIVINQSLSQKIFGNENPVGKTLKHDKKVLTIQGVIKDSPANVHHKLNVLFSQSDFPSNDISAIRRSEGYWMPSTYTFILLKPNSDIEAITENFEPFFSKYMATFGKRINAKFKPIATPLSNLHFSRHMSYDYPKGNKSYSYILTFVALFIFLIALLIALITVSWQTFRAAQRNPVDALRYE